MIKNNAQHWKLILEALEQAQAITKMREDMMPSIPNSQETNNPSEVKYFLPTIKITEDWGKIGSKDRQIIEKFTKNIEGSTLEAKLSNINKVITERSAATIPQILGTMVVIEVLNSVLREFTESAGGFIFEGFLAGLFGGASVQITDTKDQEEAGEASDASGKPITDVVLGGREYSLKLLGQTTAVKGSFKNMVEHFRVKDHVVYLDARRIHGENKDGSKGSVKGLEFGEFVITRQNFAQVFVDPFLKEVNANRIGIETGRKLKNAFKKLQDSNSPIKELKLSKKWKGVKNFTFGKERIASDTPQQLDELTYYGSDFDTIITEFFQLSTTEMDEYAPFTIAWAVSKFEGTKAEKLFGTFSKAEQIKRESAAGNTEALIAALATTPGYKKSQQFDFTRKQAESIVGFKTIGELQISPETLQETWLAYGEVLSQTVEPIYKALSEFNENINSFLTEEQNDDGNRKQYGLAAGSSANELKNATDSAVQQITQTADVPSE